jgi:predicted ArsR family transcriptional regulator
MDAAQLGERLGLTAMAVRQHLYELQREKLVTAEERPVPLGRPAKHWQLTREADRLFPDAYAELSVALIDALGDAFGNAGLERVLESRCARQKADYGKRIATTLSLKEKLQKLALIRTEEATWPK